MKTEDLKWTGSDGNTYHGYLVTPGRPNGGAMLIAHNLSGLTESDRLHARDFAELGYTALAIDYIGEGRILKPPEYWPFVYRHTFNATNLRASMQGGYDILLKQPGVAAERIAAIGYCYGGLVAMEFAKGRANVAAVVALHSSLPTDRPEENRNIKCPLLVLNAAGDAYVPWDNTIEFQQQMEAAGVNLELTFLGSTPHGYTGRVNETGEPRLAGTGYFERSDKRSWRLMTDLLARTIGPTSDA